MAAVTSTIAAGVSLAGLGMSIGQAVKQNQLQKQAEQEAKIAANKIAGMKEMNPFASVQVPTLGFDLAQQGIDRTLATSVAALGATPEMTLGGLPVATQAQNEQELRLAAMANEAAYNRDVMQANAQSGINQRDIARKSQLEWSRLHGSQLARANAIQNKQAAISGAFGAAGNIIGLIGDYSAQDPYRQERMADQRAIRREDKSFTKGESDLSSWTPEGTQIVYDVNGNPIAVPTTNDWMYAGGYPGLTGNTTF